MGLSENTQSVSDSASGRCGYFSCQRLAHFEDLFCDGQCHLNCNQHSSSNRRILCTTCAFIGYGRDNAVLCNTCHFRRRLLESQMTSYRNLCSQCAQSGNGRQLHDQNIPDYLIQTQYPQDRHFSWNYAAGSGLHQDNQDTGPRYYQGMSQSGRCCAEIMEEQQCSQGRAGSEHCCSDVTQAEYCCQEMTQNAYCCEGRTQNDFCCQGRSQSENCCSNRAVSRDWLGRTQADYCVERQLDQTGPSTIEACDCYSTSLQRASVCGDPSRLYWLPGDASSQDPLLLDSQSQQSNMGQYNLGQVRRSESYDNRQSLSEAMMRQMGLSDDDTQRRHNNRMLKSRSMNLPVTRPRLPCPFPELAAAAQPAGASHERGVSPLSLYNGSGSGDSAGNSPTNSGSPGPGSPHSTSPTRAEGRRSSTRGSSESLHYLENVAPQKVMLTFHYDDHTYHDVAVDDEVRVADVIRFLVLKSQAKEDKSWSVVESIGKLSLERSLEDHEVLLPVHRCWPASEECGEASNKFLFRKDFRKYALFQQPVQFFPARMLDTKDGSPGLDQLSDRHTNVLLQNLFSTNERMPDIQGWLHCRDTTRRSWKRYFFVLRRSGLYYSQKGTSKDPRHLVLFADLANVNIYSMLSAKKLASAPTSFCVCLKAPGALVKDARDLKLLCADDEQMKTCWLMGMRLVKYGPQIRDNFTAAVRFENHIQSPEPGSSNSSIHRYSRSHVKSRVAMDYTGPVGGRVVDDPNEAIGVALEEAYTWRRTKRGTPPAGTSPASTPPTRPSAGGVGAAMLHLTQPWYHAGVSRDEAVALIEASAPVDGVFLVRDSSSLPGVVVLSLAHAGRVRHCTIKTIEQDGELFFSLDGQTKFSDLIQLIEFYQLNANGLPTKLTHYVTKIH